MPRCRPANRCGRSRPGPASPCSVPPSPCSTTRSTRSATRRCGPCEGASVSEAHEILEVAGLSVDYVLPRHDVRAVDDVSFTVARGEFLGIVGESGCGKSTLLFAVAQLLAPPARICGGTVRFQGKNLVGLTDKQLSAIRWRDVSVVMQSAMNALNPVTSIGKQFKDAMQAHGEIGR